MQEIVTKKTQKLANLLKNLLVWAGFWGFWL